MTVMVDMKKRSPTVPSARNIVEFSKADKFAELLTLSGADSFLINTDEFEYGGAESDLKECVASTKLARPERPPANIVKDIIIHPVQIARALDQGASGVLLIVAVVGGDLELPLIPLVLPVFMWFVIMMVSLVSLRDRASSLLRPRALPSLLVTWTP